MTTATSGNVSMPATTRAPRVLTDDERSVFARVADILIPAHGGAPAASAEPGFWDRLALALDARADAFNDIVDALAALGQTEPASLWSQLQSLDREWPATFQALSTVAVGAWLLTPGARDRIGYHGQQSDKADLDEAANEISSGVLEPVLDRAAADESRWIR